MHFSLIPDAAQSTQELTSSTKNPTSSLSQTYVERTKENAIFLRLMRELDAQKKSETDRIRERKEEEKILQTKKAQQRRINELLSLIAHLKAQLISSGYDKAIESELGRLQTELFWLTFSF